MAVNPSEPPSGGAAGAALRRLRAVALGEGLTLLVLLSTAAWRRLGSGPDLAGPLGALHSVVFVGYLVAVIVAREECGWSRRRTAGFVCAAVVPLAGLALTERVIASELSRT